jgi:hypothetical protein
MNTKQKYFPGRVIFDHLHKTAGQAVNAWLADELGGGSVTPNLVGSHGELIRKYGGRYSIISAHIFFENSEGLDGRYQYLTLFRDPIDRVVSWLYFLKENHEGLDMPLLRSAAIKFLESDGENSDGLYGISNEYVEHFCRINGSGTESDEVKYANALAAIKQYDIVGLYHELPRFLADVSALIGVPAPSQISRINATKARLKIEHISPVLRKRLVALNQLDLRLFEEVVAWKASVENGLSFQSNSLSERKWTKFELTGLKGNRVFNIPDIRIHSASIREGHEILCGQSITFDVDFSLDKFVHDLEVGIHIFDENLEFVFGINSNLLGQSHELLECGFYRVCYYLLADLPAGKYTAGFGFADRMPSGEMQQLAWYDVLCDFQINHLTNRRSVGYSDLPVTISIRKIPAQNRYHFKAGDSRILSQVGFIDGDKIVSTGALGYLIHGPYISLEAGNYRVVIRGAIGTNTDAGAFMDIVFNNGDSVIAETLLPSPDMNGQIIVFPFSLEKRCSDLEIRILVNESSTLAISSIDILRINSN